MTIDPHAVLNDLFKVAVGAADPLKTLPPHLPQRPDGRVIVIGAGKASAAMAKAVETAWSDSDISGLVVTRYGYAVPTDKIEIIEAAHPVPDEAGQKACERITALLKDLGPDDLVLSLISGGGSALLSAPAPCLSSGDKPALNKALLKSGATIHEMNCVRKHLSTVKGGLLAKTAYPARVITLVVSDVPGDDPRTVASGPTLPDPTTLAQARAIMAKYDIEVSDAVWDWLDDPAHETPKPGDKIFERNEVKVISSAAQALEAAAVRARSHGLEPVILGDAIEGEARDVGASHARQAAEYQGKKPVVLLSGGETTVTVKHRGRGGRNTEYLLAAALTAEDHHNIYGLACDTDGIDGSEDNAGAYFTPYTLKMAREKGLDPQQFLEKNDAFSFFEAVNGLVITGPTYTNVNDFRAILIP